MFWFEDVRFRPVEKRDIEQIRQLRNEPSTWIFLTDVTQITPFMQEQWFAKISTAKDQAYFSIFEEKKDFPISTEGDFLGIIRFDQMDGTNKSVRVGCDIVPEKRGKGYGTKTFKAILEFCFDHWNMHRLHLCVLENNEVAIKLYKNVGFKEEGRQREAIWRSGEYKDYIVMSILEDEYRGKNAL